MRRPRPPMYAGYIGWPDGLGVWPSQLRKWRWGEIVSITTVLSPLARSIRTRFQFRSGKAFTLGATRDFRWTKARGRYAEIVALAVARAPAEATIDENTLDVAQFGPRAVRRAALQPDGASQPSAGLYFERARHHRVWLERDRALLFAGKALEMQPDHAGALRLRCQIYNELERPREARRAAEDWAARYPDDREAQAVLFQLKLAGNDASAVQDARDLLACAPEFASLADSLSGYHADRGEFSEAAAVWTRLEDSTADPEVRKRAGERAAYFTRYVRDKGFRMREKAKGWLRVALIWSVALAPLLIPAGLFVHRWNEKRQWNERIEQMRREIDQSIERSERNFTELTGRIFGSPEQVRVRAGKGESAAQFTYGEMLLEGDRVPKDVAAGIGYLEEAAGQDHREALKRLAGIFREGKLVEADPARAVSLLQRAADMGSPWAAAELGKMYLKGDGVSVDKAAAFVLFERAAGGGNLFAVKQAGWMLELGEGTERDVGRALGYYRLAAEKEDIWSIERLARLLSTRNGDHRDAKEAWEWIRAGAKVGSAELRVLFASAVFEGAMGDDDESRNAVPWLVEAAEGGSSVAQGMLGSCYLNGWGVEQDFAEAVLWLEKGEPTNQKCRAVLAHCHAFGLGVPRDPSKARELRARINDPREQEWVDRYLKGAETVAKLQRQPVPVFQDNPLYPLQMSKNGIEGRVVLRFWIDRDGFVRDVRVRSSTRSEFEAPARLALSRWKFAPLDGMDSLNTEAPFSFSLAQGNEVNRN